MHGSTGVKVLLHITVGSVNHNGSYLTWQTWNFQNILTTVTIHEALSSTGAGNRTRAYHTILETSWHTAGRESSTHA